MRDMAGQYPTYERLWAFVNGQLGNAETAEIEQMMLADEGLLLEVEEIRLLAQRDEKGLAQLDLHREHIHDALEKQYTRPKTDYSYLLWAAAAMIVVLIGVGLAFSIFQGDSVKPETLLAWQEVPALRAESADTEFSKILEAGKTGEWQLVVRDLEQFVASNPTRLEARLYLARAYYLISRPIKGRDMLTYIIETGEASPKMRLDAQWYRAIGQLHDGDCEAAKLDFEAISPQVGTKRKQYIADLIHHCL